MSNLPKYRSQPELTPVYDPDLSHGSNQSATSARVVRSPRALRRQAGNRRGDGCLRIRQKHGRGPARQRAGLSFPGRRRPTPARECREDAKRDSADRRRPAAPGLRKIAEEIDGWRARGECGVLTCSALKRSYRDLIIGGRHDVALVYLEGSHDLIHRRMAARHEHYMPYCLARQPIRDIGGADARRAPDHRRCRRQTGRDRPRDRVQLEARQSEGNGPAPPASTGPREDL